jgi:uncharacterized RDD family membrane protein YckC
MSEPLPLGERDPSAVREIETPEGVPLRVVLAPRGERAVAFLFDGAIWGGAIVVIAVLAALAARGGNFETSWTSPFVVVAAFLLRSFYYTWFELRWGGRTPGKRKLRLRVIDRHGGPLTAEAVIARNLMREVEVFLPLSLLLAPEVMWPGGSVAVQWLASLWAFVLALMPLFNRGRLRAGDMVGGTMVVVEPRLELLDELGGGAGASPGDYLFTPAQLAVYGAYELQVLEKLLRREPSAGYADALAVVAERIKQKLDWKPSGEPPDDFRFLRAYYVALRRHLEHRMLLGRRRADKHDRA